MYWNFGKCVFEQIWKVKVKLSYTRNRALGQELIPVYRCTDSQPSGDVLSHFLAVVSCITFRQACGHLPSQRTSPSFDQYHWLVTEAYRYKKTCRRLLRSFVPVKIEPTIYWSQVQRLTTTPPNDCVFIGPPSYVSSHLNEIKQSFTFHTLMFHISCITLCVW